MIPKEKMITDWHKSHQSLKRDVLSVAATQNTLVCPAGGKRGEKRGKEMEKGSGITIFIGVFNVSF